MFVDIIAPDLKFPTVFDTIADLKRAMGVKILFNISIAINVRLMTLSANLEQLFHAIFHLLNPVFEFIC